MKKKLQLLPLVSFLLAVLLATASCVDREKEPLSNTAPSSSTSGNLPTVGNYYPLTIGTKWAYEIGSGLIDTTMLDRDSMFAGQVYKHFRTGTNDYFIREQGGVYYRREVNGLAIPDATGTIERTELRTDVGVNKAWNDDLSLSTGDRKSVV